MHMCLYIVENLWSTFYLSGVFSFLKGKIQKAEFFFRKQLL